MRTPSRDWATLVQEFKSSGMSQKGFCEAKGISLATFTYWLKKSRPSETVAPETAGFVQLDVLSKVARRMQPGGDGELVVELPLGVLLRFRGVAH